MPDRIDGKSVALSSIGNHADMEASDRPRSRKRRQYYSEEISKRHHHDRNQDFADDCTATPDEETVKVTNNENLFCEDRLNDTLLVWDFDVNLSWIGTNL
jgi:hypothetical protein